MMKNKRTRRGRGGNRKCKNLSFKIVGNNCAGLKGKIDSFKNLLMNCSPAIVMLQETKLYKRGTIKFNQFQCFEKLRSEKEGGGLMTLIHKNMDPVIIPTKSQSKMGLNVLVIEANIRNMKIRFINAYGVQECAAIEEKLEFYSIIEEEILIALSSKRMVCIAMDANAKLGKKNILGDTHEISNNGRILLNLVERLNLVVVNSTRKCQGTTTRMRNVKNKLEESIIDYFIVCQDFYLIINSMEVDTKRKYVLTKYTKKKGRSFTTESDHNPLILDVNIPCNSKIKEDRIEIYNLRNKNCQNEFFQNTNAGDRLTRCLLNKNVKEGGKLWIKNLKMIISQNFKKIRIRKRECKENLKISSLINQKRGLKDREKEKISEDIAERIFEKNRKNYH